MKKSNFLKSIGLFAVFAICSIQINAQQTSGDVTKAANVNYGTTTTGGAIKVIDNKGTIKYLQTKNGITTLTNTTADVTTTTWQLGGVLTDDTYIDVDAALFGLDGLELVDTSTLAASIDATTGSDHGVGTGWTVLVRDEASGATKKLLASDLIQSGQETFTVAAVPSTTYTTAATALPVFSQVWVYRNGAKLVANVDYTLATNVLTLVPVAGTGQNSWALYEDDIIEIHYVK